MLKTLITLVVCGACVFFVYTQIRGIIKDFKAKKEKKAKVVNANEGQEAETTEN